MATDSSWLESMPEFYDRCLGPTMFAPYAQRLAVIAASRNPRAVLELAAGTGILTTQLVRALPTADITATDLNRAMVSSAALRVSGPRWLAADAQSLRFPDDTFDMIMCQFGVMFFPDKTAAFAQAARVLRPDGVYVFTVWDAVELSPFPDALVTALVDVFPTDPPDFVARIPHGYHDAGRIRTDAAAGGLEVQDIERIVLRGSASSARTLAEGFCYGSPLRFALQDRGDLEQLTEAVVEQMTLRLGTGTVEGDLAALIVTARRS